MVECRHPVATAHGSAACGPWPHFFPKLIPQPVQPYSAQLVVLPSGDTRASQNAPVDPPASASQKQETPPVALRPVENRRTETLFFPSCTNSKPSLTLSFLPSRTVAFSAVTSSFLLEFWFCPPGPRA